jgi:pyruvate formate-lyase activating enzyme-like uncharacterized protein
MKQHFLIFFSFFFLGKIAAQTKTPAEYLQAYWYSPTTKQMFVIKNDTRVKYSNGNGKFVEMEIMSQSSESTELGTDIFIMKLYQKKNDKMVYILKLYPDSKALEITETGKRDKPIKFYNLEDMMPNVK